MDEHIENQRLRRADGGYYETPDSGSVAGCDADEDQCAQDDDPDSVTTHPPGTADDIPVTLGEEHAEPADYHIGVGGAAPPGEDPELWDAQGPLRSIDEAAGYKVGAFDEGEREALDRALGDEDAEPLPDYPGGTSATGSTGRPE